MKMPHKLPHKLPLLAVLLSGIFAGSAKGSTITVSATIADLASPWSQTLGIQQFDTTLGVLTGVEIQATINLTATIDFLNTLWSNGCVIQSGCPNPVPVHSPGGGQDVLAASASIPFTLTGPTGSVSGTATVDLPGAVVVPPTSELPSWFCMNPTPHVSPVNEGECFPLPGTPVNGQLAVSGLTSSTTTPWTSVGLPGWSGPGVALVNFNATTLNTDCSREAQAGVFVGCEATAGGTFSVRYTYNEYSVPEPGFPVLLGSALLGIGLLGRWRTRIR
jgi:hypothetical protein